MPQNYNFQNQNRESLDSLLAALQSMAQVFGQNRLLAEQQRKQEEAAQQAQGFFTQPTQEQNIPTGYGSFSVPMQVPSGSPQPNISAMLAALFSPNQYSQQNAKTALGTSEMFQPKYQTVNQENGGLQLVTIPPFGGKPTVEQVQAPQQLLKPQYKTETVTVNEGGKPMQYSIIRDEYGKEIARNRIGEEYVKPPEQSPPNTTEVTVNESGNPVKYRIFYDRNGNEIRRQRVGEQYEKPPAQAKQAEAADKLSAFELNLSQYENTLKNIQGGRIGGTLSKAAAMVEMNPEARAAVGMQNSLAGLLARTVMGEVGVLTDQDIERAKTMLPQITDNQTERALKFQKLRQIVSDRKSALSSQQNQPLGNGTIRVKRKFDGKVGSMPAANFNPALYEKIQ